MVRNEARRAALLDAAVEVLAREGARGLTFRAVDAKAAVPAGTASNYFPSRDALFDEIGPHVFTRLTPDPVAVEETMRAPRDLALLTRLMLDLFDRAVTDRAGYLALMELRMEATRRPGLRTAFTEISRADLTTATAFHVDSGLPGGKRAVELLHIGMWGLILEHLTLPGVITDERALIAEMVRRVTRA